MLLRHPQLPYIALDWAALMELDIDDANSLGEIIQEMREAHSTEG